MRKMNKKAVLMLLGILALAVVAVFVGANLLKGLGARDVVKFADLRKYIDNVPNAGVDISQLDLKAQANALEVLPFVQFNLNTTWPEKDKMPVGFDPLKLLTAAKNPGLGIAALHAQGITGKGIAIGVMDMPIYTKNLEVKDRIVKYKTFGQTEVKAGATACATLSALVGKTVGVAPEADVYYAAVATDRLDVLYYSEAMDWFIALNKNLKPENRIRLVMVPVAPDNVGEGDYNTPFDKNTELWSAALKKAEAAGIVVFDLTNRRAIGSCWLDTKKPDDFKSVQTGYPDKPEADVTQNDVLMPTCPKTVVEEYIEGQTGYRYIPQTGAPFITSFATGLAALGMQAGGYEKTKVFTLETYNTKFRETAYVLKNGPKINYIVDPKAFVAAMKK